MENHFMEYYISIKNNEVYMKKISRVKESCGLQKLHFSKGQCQIIKSKERMMLSTLQTNPKGEYPSYIVL